MILPFAVSAAPCSCSAKVFRSLPRSPFDAAPVDGASDLQILVRIAILLSRPAILTAVLVTFIGPWDEFLWPFLITKDINRQPLAVALATNVADAVKV